MANTKNLKRWNCKYFAACHYIYFSSDILYNISDQIKVYSGDKHRDTKIDSLGPEYWKSSERICSQKGTTLIKFYDISLELILLIQQYVDDQKTQRT